MPSFDTPEPISVTAHLTAGSLRLTAGDRTDTVVQTRPRDPKKDADVRAAEQTEITYTGGVLSLRTPKPRYLVGRTGTVDITVELPTDSRIEMTGDWAQLLGEGRLGEVRVKKISSGDVRLDTTGPLHLNVTHGSITVDRVNGPAEIATSSGSLRVGIIDGTATLKNSHGSTVLGAALGEVRVSAANGDVDIQRAESSVTATAAHGTLRVADVARGTTQLENAYGAIEIGIRQDTATWLDVNSERGQVRNMLNPTDTPHATDDTLEVRARSRYGNIDIRHARP
ncbi:DUF4097 domain-containing protein [Streptomyces sp. BHT-5-2]|uniref:DUF4097 family beta strand repeat-containing protein n=1 Tax=unclassified Streptomyces TaxID=2593676 RepID=UPI001C8D0161|nr:DUF4097 family beta strand repeat-containing protein [Streptomyces sp. BHT-5-2]QZL03382.1 DUF4097 domain-containing protein [Streptomyces sp. BHT-5-2]